MGIHGVTAFVTAPTKGSNGPIEQNMTFGALPRVGETLRFEGESYFVAAVGWDAVTHSNIGSGKTVANPSVTLT
jgi:hypothetical protein